LHLTLLFYPQQLGLDLIEDQLVAELAINAGVPNCEKVVSFLEDLGPFLRHLVLAIRAGQKADFPLAKRAVNVGTAKTSK
jgi:hypothetical protein